jgi:hypothetical protein
MPDPLPRRFPDDPTRAAPTDTASQRDQLPARALWEPPSAPPPRPAGAPTTFGPSGPLTEYRSNQSPKTPPHLRGRSLGLIWAYLDGQWQAASVDAECRGGDGWLWWWASLETGNAWVLRVRTAERAPSPADREWASRIWAADHDQGAAAPTDAVSKIPIP